MSDLMLFRIIPFAGSAISLALAIVFAVLVSKKSRGTKRMIEISNAMFAGSRVYLNQQLKIISPFLWKQEN